MATILPKAYSVPLLLQPGSQTIHSELDLGQETGKSPAISTITTFGILASSMSRLDHNDLNFDALSSPSKVHHREKNHHERNHHERNSPQSDQMYVCYAIELEKVV